MCGDCGAGWKDDAALSEAITRVIAFYPYRAEVYDEVGGRWEGVALSDEPKNTRAGSTRRRASPAAAAGRAAAPGGAPARGVKGKRRA